MAKARAVQVLVILVLLCLAFAGGAIYQSRQSAHSFSSIALLSTQGESVWWSHFLGSLNRAADLVESSTQGGSELDRLEGYRLMSRMMGLGGTNQGLLILQRIQEGVHGERVGFGNG